MFDSVDSIMEIKFKSIVLFAFYIVIVNSARVHRIIENNPRGAGVGNEENVRNSIVKETSRDVVAGLFSVGLFLFMMFVDCMAFCTTSFSQADYHNRYIRYV